MLLTVRECSCSLTDDDKGVAVSAWLSFITELAVVLSLSQKGHKMQPFGPGILKGMYMGVRVIL